jgi:hypothetical protein
MVSIAAFQAVDPGSIPGHRIFFDSFTIICLKVNQFPRNVTLKPSNVYLVNLTKKSFKIVCVNYTVLK